MPAKRRLKRRPPLVRFRARLDQIGARLGILARDVRRWSLEGSEWPAVLGGLLNYISVMETSQRHTVEMVEGLIRKGYVPPAAGRSRRIRRGAVVSVRPEHRALYEAAWPGEVLHALFVTDVVGGRPVFKGRRGPLGPAPASHFMLPAA